MKSLFDPSVNKEILERIDKLTPDTEAKWGEMNVAQMLTHAQRPLKVAYGELLLKRGLIGILFGGMAKRSLLKPEPFKKHLPTDPNFVVKDTRIFEEEKENLRNLVIKFEKSGPDALTKDPHPFFGKLTVDEWDALQWKHLDHHLRQFGV
jgi:hypothetical protein